MRDFVTPLLLGQACGIGLMKSEPALRADQSLATAQEDGRAGRKAAADHISCELADRDQISHTRRLGDASAGGIQMHDLNRGHGVEKSLKVLGGPEGDAAGEL